MASPGHRANILGPYSLCGIGEAMGKNGSIWWCVDFVQ
jgi:uncharacterized protein YkwD